MTRVNEDGLDPLGWRSTNENGEWWRTGHTSRHFSAFERGNPMEYHGS